MNKKFFGMCFVLLLCALLVGCGTCQHQWSDADCVNAVSAHFAVKCRERLLATTGLRPHARVPRHAAVVEKHRENFRGISG